MSTPSSPSVPLLSVQGVDAGYGAVQALRGVSLAVHAGEIVTLIGANGAGKSSLLMTICGNPPAQRGHILFAGQNITGLPTHTIARLGVAHVPEGRRVFARMTVEENLAMGTVAAPVAMTRTGGGGPMTGVPWSLWNGSITSFPVCRSVPGSGREPSLAASSKCWPLAVP